MNQKRIAWVLNQAVDGLNKFDFITLFLLVFFLASALWVLPEYETNLSNVQSDSQSVRKELKQYRKQQNPQTSATKVLLGAPVIEISKAYSHQNIQVLDAKYDPEGHQLQLTVSGAIQTLLNTTHDLEQYQNIKLLGFSIVQNEIKNQPTVQVTWQVQEQK